MAFNDRLAKLENENAQIKADQLDTKDEITTLREEMKNAMDEEIRKMRKISNIIIYGISETDEGLEIVKKILSVILPKTHYSINIVNDRLGPEILSQNRPLRIQLNSPLEKRTALQNCKKLAGIDEFKGISVSPDLTKQQQQTRRVARQQQLSRKTPVRTRSHASNERIKRKNESSVSDQPIKKSTRMDIQIDSE